MKGLLNPAGRPAPARFFGGAFSQRHLASATLGAFASVLFAPYGAFALSNTTLKLSPQVAKSTLISAMDPATEIIVQLTLPLSDRQGASDLAKHVSTPKDPLFHHYITAQEFAARFGTNAADYATVRAWAVANGLSIVHEASARNSLSLRGTVAQLQQLFKTQLSYYRAPSGDQFYSASVEPTVPSEIGSKLRAVVGLTGGVQKASLYKIGKVLGENPETPGVHTDTAGGTGPGGTYSASDLRTAYVIPKFGGASPQVVAVFEDSAIHRSDYLEYLTRMHLGSIPLRQIPVDQTTLEINGDQLEAVLDVDMIAGINPDAKEIQLYDAANANTISEFSTDLVDVFDTVATAASSPGGPQTLSVSYGLDEIEIVEGGGDIDAEQEALIELANVGVSVLVSAGDQGAYGRTGLDNNPPTLNVSDPGSQIFATCVGGTTLFTYSKQQYLGEEVWNDLGIGDGATGGGVSAGWELPDFGEYQNPDLVTINGGSSEFRNVPDVAAVADPLTGVGIYVKAAGGWLQIGGTSASAPIWAGYVSILNAAEQYLVNSTSPEVGFFNPALYVTALSYDLDSFPTGNLYPILDGTNGNYNLYGVAGYGAGPLYNNCCGLGSLWGPYSFAVLNDITETSPPPTVTVAVEPSTTSAKITWTKSTGATGYVVFVDLQQNGSPTFAGETTITRGTSVNVTGLIADQPYVAYVTAIDSSGSSISSPVYFNTLK